MTRRNGRGRWSATSRITPSGPSAINSFITIRLSDGHCDVPLDDSKQAPVRGCKGNEIYYAFFSFRSAPHGFAGPKDAAIFRALHRMAYDNGARLPDPDDPHGGPDLIMPDQNEHRQNQLTRMMRQGVMQCPRD